MDFDEIRFEPQRLIEKLERAFLMATLLEDDCAGTQGLGVGRLQLQSLIERGNRRITTAERP